MIEPLGWESIANALNLASYDDGSVSNDAPLELTTARAVTDGARAIYPMPRCDAWLLGPSREPRSRARVARVGVALGWTLGAGANAPDAARALRALTTADRLRGGAHAWRALPVTFGAPPSDPSLARTLAQVEALVASERAVVVTGHGDEAAAVAAVASLIGAARADAGSRFAGDGRWWIARMREAVAAARREAVPGRRL